MKRKVNIVVLVDVIGALSERTLLDSNLSMMDDGPCQSTGQGTPELSTACYPGQLVQWTARAVDLQTPVAIRSIAFLGGERGEAAPAHPNAPVPPAAPDDGDRGDDSDDLDLKVWSGVVPACMVPGRTYRYRLELQMYRGSESVLAIDSPSLRCAYPPVVDPTSGQGETSA